MLALTGQTTLLTPKAPARLQHSDACKASVRLHRAPCFTQRSSFARRAAHSQHKDESAFPESHCWSCAVNALQRWQDTVQQASQKVVAGVMALALIAAIQQPDPALAVLNSPNASIPRTVDAALRRSIPAFNTDVLTIQKKLEDITYKLRIPQRKPWPEMAKDITAATNVVQNRDKVMYGVPQGEEQRAQQLADDILNGLRSAQTSIEGRDADKTSKRVNKVLGQVAALELIQAPGLPYSIPKEFERLPRLTGRATVELDVQRGGGNPAFITQDGGGPQKVAHIEIELDGYSAPITAGNFAAKVVGGELVNRRLASSYTSVLVEDSIDDAGKTIPLELMAAGAFDPLYRTHLDVNSGELPVLPLSIYGAVAMSHAPDTPDDDSAASQFFLYKFVRQNSGLAGLSFDEGQFAVCGYVTGGIDLVPQLQTGDIITQARLVQGKDRLIMPEGSQQQHQQQPET